MLQYFFVFLFLLYIATLSMRNTFFNQREGLDTSHKSKKDTGITIGGGDYNNQGLPKGIPKHQIPDGDEDLYILKSQVVPPVCPKCPEPIIYEKECPPCPRCERCPEPSFECKKVPTYRKDDSLTIPRPVLNDFSQFGL